jgi:hypothetical protein
MVIGKGEGDGQRGSKLEEDARSWRTVLSYVQPPTVSSLIIATNQRLPLLAAQKRRTGIQEPEITDPRQEAAIAVKQNTDWDQPLTVSLLW